MSKLSIRGNIGLANLAGEIDAAGDLELGGRIAINAAKPGTLSTRSSDTAGTLTLGADHGIIDICEVESAFKIGCFIDPASAVLATPKIEVKTSSLVPRGERAGKNQILILEDKDFGR